VKLYRLSKKEIRISLSREDLCRYAITPEEFDYDSTKGKRILWELFDLAKEETGFDAAGERIYIQLYEKKNGGCEIFVTQLEDESDTESCFVFSDLESLFAALSLFTKFPEEIRIYRVGKTLRHLVVLPHRTIPNGFWEYGRKTDSLPSSIYLKSQCRKIDFPERKYAYGKRNENEKT